MVGRFGKWLPSRKSASCPTHKPPRCPCLKISRPEYVTVGTVDLVPTMDFGHGIHTEIWYAFLLMPSVHIKPEGY
jgi:hypothetical protein